MSYVALRHREIYVCVVFVLKMMCVYLKHRNVAQLMLRYRLNTKYRLKRLSDRFV